MTTFAFTNWAYAYFISGLFILVIAILLFQRKRKDQVVFIFTLGCFLATILCFATGIIVCTVKVELWKTFAYIYYFTDLVGLTMIFHFSQLYRKNEKIMENKKLLLLYVLLLVFMLAIIIKPDLIDGDIQNKLADPFGHILPGRGGGIVGNFFQYYLLVISVVTFVNLIRVFRQKEDLVRRRQGSYFVFSYFFVLIGTVISNFFKMALGAHILVNTSLLLMPVSMSIIAYGILKEK